jgi:hypothetical protein
MKAIRHKTKHILLFSHPLPSRSLFQILAEVQAILHDYQACLKALRDAEKFFEGVRHSPDEETS